MIERSVISRRVRPRLLALCLGVAVLAIGCSGASGEAKVRVEKMLNSIAAGDDGTAADAFAGFYDIGDAGRRYDSMLHFMNASGMKKGMTWSVERVEGGDPPTVIVQIDGKQLRLAVPEGKDVRLLE